MWSRARGLARAEAVDKLEENLLLPEDVEELARAPEFTPGLPFHDDLSAVLARITKSYETTRGSLSGYFGSNFISQIRAAQRLRRRGEAEPSRGWRSSSDRRQDVHSEGEGRSLLLDEVLPRMTRQAAEIEEATGQLAAATPSWEVRRRSHAGTAAAGARELHSGLAELRKIWPPRAPRIGS